MKRIFPTERNRSRMQAKRREANANQTKQN